MTIIVKKTKMGVANQLADYAGRYARGKEYGLSKKGEEICCDIRYFKKYKEIPGALLNEEQIGKTRFNGSLLL